jgi:hypothetical protein
MSKLIPSKAPNLNLPPKDYDQQHQNQLTNQLKLYFQQNDSNNGQLIQQSGNSSVSMWLNMGSF